MICRNTEDSGTAGQTKVQRLSRRGVLAQFPLIYKLSNASPSAAALATVIVAESSLGLQRRMKDKVTDSDVPTTLSS